MAKLKGLANQNFCTFKFTNLDKKERIFLRMVGENGPKFHIHQPFFRTFLGLVLQVFLYLAAFECNRTSDRLNQKLCYMQIYKSWRKRLIDWCFTPLSTVFQSHHCNSSHYSCLSWVSPVLG